MSKTRTKPPRAAGNALIGGAAIGTLSILLVVGLKMLGILEKLDLFVSKSLSAGQMPVFSKFLPPVAVWLGALLFAFGIAFAILNVPGTWRRIMLWLTALVLLAGWAPVLSLAAYAPTVCAPWIAALWSGICALIYARNHRMPCDLVFADPPSGKK